MMALAPGFRLRVAESLDHWQELAALPENTNKVEQLKFPLVVKLPPRFVAESKVTDTTAPSSENCAVVS